MIGHRMGYICVKGVEQNPERQVFLERVLADQASAKDARNLDGLRRMVKMLIQRGVSVEFVQEHLMFTGNDCPHGDSCAVRHGSRCDL